MSNCEREHISFNTNKEIEEKLYIYFLTQAKIYGKSGYIKELIRRDMEINEENAEKYN